MSKNEKIQFQEALKRQKEEIDGSRTAAKNLLLQLGLITKKGNLSKSFKQVKS